MLQRATRKLSIMALRFGLSEIVSFTSKLNLRSIVETV